MRHHFTSTQLVLKKQARSGEEVEKPEPSHMADGNENDAVATENAHGGLSRLDIELPSDPAIPFLHI